MQLMYSAYIKYVPIIDLKKLNMGAWVFQNIDKNKMLIRVGSDF